VRRANDTWSTVHWDWALGWNGAVEFRLEASIMLGIASLRLRDVAIRTRLLGSKV
jgi:hypothetical protein